MELTVQGKQIDVGDALREHIENKITDLDQKYFNNTTTATVTLSKEGHGHGQFKAHISVMIGKNITVIVDALAGDPYGAFDSAAEKAAKRMRRYKKRFRDHHARAEKTPEDEITKARNYVLAANVGNEEIEEQDNNFDGVPIGDDPVVIAEISTDIETMSVSDAVMRMDLSDQNAMMFRNAANNQINMVYRRADGNVGWVDPADAEAAA